MEKDAHYAAVGIATVLLLTALAVFVIWLARLQFANDYDIYDIVFDGPVTGLSEGGEVHFNGIRFGEVTDLNLDPERGNRVIARVRLEADLPIRTTSRAQLEPQGITGLNFIQITAGDPNSPMLKAQYGEHDVPVIQSQPSPLAELLSGGGTVLTQTAEALNRVNRILADENIRSFATSVKNVESLTSELEARKGMFMELEQAIASANRAVGEYEKLGVSARQIIETDGRQAIVNINQATSDAQQVIASVNRSATSLEAPLGDFGSQTVPALNDTIRQLDEATRSLQSLIDNVRQSPRDFISRGPSKEIEVQP